MIPAALAALDLNALWDFRQPAISEQRFREALKTAQGDDVLVLQTQIARSFGLRKDFHQARTVLKAAESGLAQAGGEVQVRWWLEWGRSWASATHPREAETPETLAQARQAYQRALDLARQYGLDGLAIDAIHMFAFVDRAPTDQLRWGEAALAVVLASPQPAAQRWQASVRHNVGYALHQLGRYEEALTQFQQALVLRERALQSAANLRMGRWMVAWTLRALNRGPEALAQQLQLEREADAAGAPDVYVFEELEALYRAQGDTDRAAFYARRRAAVAP